jgi:hypothetical protein
MKEEMTTNENNEGRALQSAAPTTTSRDFSWNSTKSQCARLLAALMKGPVTTIDARRLLDIMAPAARVFTLRHRFGKNIVTTWLDDMTTEGGVHRVARYVLLDGANGGAA